MGYMLTWEKISAAETTLRSTSSGFLPEGFVCSAFNSQFSSELDSRTKHLLKDLLTENFRREARLRNMPEPQKPNRLFTNRIIAPVMSGGYWHGSKIFGQLLEAGFSPEVVFPGYWSSARRFHGGFTGQERKLAEDRLYLLSEDLEAMRRHPSPRLLLVENAIETGKTILGISKSLAELGVTDILCYAAEDRRHGFSDSESYKDLTFAVKDGYIMEIKDISRN